MSKVPNRPGIYGFHDAAGRLLYLGKAKSLRVRLRTYALLARRPEAEAPENVRAMLALARRLQWQEMPSEPAARERESELLHVLQPPFNIDEAWDINYPLIALRYVDDERVHFRLGETVETGFRSFGCYKHRPRAKEGYCALLRLISAAMTEDPRFYFPARLTARHPEYDCRLPFRRDWRRSLHAFLDGRSRRFLEHLMAAVLANENLSPLVYPTLKRDFRSAARFYHLGPRATRALRKRFSPQSSGPIAGDEMRQWILAEWRETWRSGI